MTSHQILDRLNEVLDELSSTSELRDLLAQISSAQNPLIDGAVKLTHSSGGGNNAPSARDAFVAYLNAAKNLTLHARPRIVFREIERIERLAALFENGQVLNQKVASAASFLGESVSEFASSYEQFLASPDTRPFMELLFATSKFNGAVDGFRSCLVSVRANLVNDSTRTKETGEGELSLYLPNESTLGAFGEKLSAVAGLYEEFCSIFKISTAQFPLKIVKVESGTTWMDILGNEVVIGFLKTTVVGAAAYLYGNYTKGGKRGQIPKQLADAEAALKIAGKLKEMGQDVTPILEQVNKVTEVAAKHMNTLLADEDAVEVDGIVHPLSPDIQRALQQGRTVLSLRDRSVPEAD